MMVSLTFDLTSKEFTNIYIVYKAGSKTPNAAITPLPGLESDRIPQPLGN
jgi:hypothetical protein